MEEIGIKLKTAREENGVSIDEAASDLKVRTDMIESVEMGRKDDFQDVFSLKYFIRDYAKYLGLDPESILDDFNGYLFEQTSKISLNDIENAKKEKEKKEKHMKIISPYTKKTKDKKTIIIIGAILLIIIIILLITYINIK